MILDTLRLYITTNISESHTFRTKVASLSNVENIYELSSGSGNYVG